MDTSDTSTSKIKDKRVAEVSNEVKQVVEILQENVNKIIERGDRLSILHHRAEGLQQGTHMFATEARVMRRRYWWHNMKMKLALCGIILILIIVVVVVWVVLR